jgi:uncharacterized protein YgiB involved in biofilm formation
MGATACSQGSLDDARAAKSGGPQLTAYSSSSDCLVDNRSDCESKWEQATKIASTLSWGFDSETQCQRSFGDECVKAGSKWKPEMVGMAVISRPSNSFSTATPVVSSSKFPGLYLPNGYPVVWGDNTVSKVFQSFGVMDASRPRDLNERVCINNSEEESCGPLHQFVSGFGHDERSLADIF